MRLFLKHIKRSVRMRPLQPLVILLTLALSVTVFSVSIGAKHALTEELRLSRLAEFGGADIEISLASSSDSRFMFTDDVRDVLGDGVSVTGYYELPIVTDSGVVFAAAVDYYELGEIFTPKFSEYGEINASRLSVSALISRRFANENSLSVGDSFSASVFNTGEVYTVEAISDVPLLSRFDVLIDIRGAMRLLSHDSSLAAALGEGFRPSSKIFVDLRDGESTSDAVAKLLLSEEFSDKSVIDIERRAVMEQSNNTFDLIFDFMIIFAAALASAVAFAALYILSYQRTEENESFLLAGARRRLISAMQYLEVGVYWAVSSAAGLILAVPILRLTARVSGLVYSSARITFGTAALSALFSLVIAMLTVTLFVLIGARTTRRRSIRGERTAMITISSLTVMLTVLTYALPQRFALGVAIAALVCLLLTAALAAPRIFVGFLQILTSRAEKRVTGGAFRGKSSVYYALKNLLRLKILHNVARLSALLVATVLCAVSVMVSANGNVGLYSNLFEADYALLGATERSAALAAGCENAERSERLFFGSVTHSNGASCVAISAESTDVLDEALGITKLPVGNGAIITRGQSEMLALGIGDEFTAEVAGVRLDLTVSEIVSSGASVLFFDSSAFGIEPNIVLVEAVDRDALAAELSTALSDEMATVITADKLMERRLEIVNTYRAVGNILLVVLSVFAVIGFGDNLYESYRSRRGELELYRYCGMRRREVARMKATEVALTALFGIVYGLVIFLSVAVIVSEALMTISYELLVNIRNGLFGA